MRKPKIFACGALFPLSFGLFTSSKSHKKSPAALWCEFCAFVQALCRQAETSKIRARRRRIFCLCFGPVTSQGSAPVGELQKYGLLACSLGLNYTWMMTADDSVVSLENMCGCLLSKARTRDTSSAQPRNTSGKADPAAPPQPTGAAPAARCFLNFI